MKCTEVISRARHPYPRHHARVALCQPPLAHHQSLFIGLTRKCIQQKAYVFIEQKHAEE